VRSALEEGKFGGDAGSKVLEKTVADLYFLESK
jgi:hypothetical protein